MGDKSKIEWTEATWNPIVGCSVVSPGCTNCYAMAVAGARLDGNPKTPQYAGTTQPSKAGPVWTGKVALAPESKLLEPLRWKRPRMIFVNSMGDLFHESVPDEWIDRVFAIMALCPQHTFQVLTKRAERMRSYFRDLGRDPANRIAASVHHFGFDDEVECAVANWINGWSTWRDVLDGNPLNGTETRWPLPNVWLGVSAEDQQRADERILHLVQTPAAVHFVSAEPLLGCIDFNCVPLEEGFYDALLGGSFIVDDIGRNHTVDGPRWAHLDWIIAGGESGPKARPMHPNWARLIRDQCQAAGVPFFFKQWGEWHPCEMRDGACYPMEGHAPFDSWKAQIYDTEAESGWNWRKLGKRAAGRFLDGREHNEMPERADD